MFLLHPGEEHVCISEDVHDAEEVEQIIALRPKADFPRCTGQSQVKMRLEGMTLCMHAKSFPLLEYQMVWREGQI